MMLKVIQVLVVFTLFVAEILGRSPRSDVEIGIPGVVDETTTECQKDLLLIIDTSYSITKYNFTKSVQPFLQKFINDSRLNVNKGGTRIAIILFSTDAKIESKTRIILNFNEEYDAEKIAQIIAALKWDEISGPETRTEKAFLLAAKIFTKDNPDNIRSGVQDVIVLATDGHPNNFKNAKKNAQVLKDRGVLIIGAAIGPKRHTFMSELKELATEGHVVDADFDKLDSIIGTIIARSCTRPAGCTCRDITSGTIPVPFGMSTAEFKWPKPSPSCKNNASPDVKGEKVSPEGITSPHNFPVGQHTVTYTFTLRRNVTVHCPPLLFKVTGKLCGSKAYDPEHQVCCCGKIHQKKSGHDCCGMLYYNTYSTKCCDETDGNLVSPIEESCPSE